MDDSTLRQDIIDELEFEPSINAAHIGVAVECGVVTLTGHVTTYAQKAAAEEVVRRVKGSRELRRRSKSGRSAPTKPPMTKSLSAR